MLKTKPLTSKFPFTTTVLSTCCLPSLYIRFFESLCTSNTAAPSLNLGLPPMNTRSTSSVAQSEPEEGPELAPIQVLLLPVTPEQAY